MQLPAVGQVFDAYAVLQQMAVRGGAEHTGYAAWLGGWLLTVFELDAGGISALIAGAVGGAAVLAVDAQRDRVKELLRFGICDFVVNDLDEAVRILKNEVRKKQPVSVCLAADLEASVAEMVERGLQPEVLAGRHLAAASVLTERGAMWLRDEPGMWPLASWRLRTEAASWAAGPVLARVDELVAEALDASSTETPLRRHWLQRAPRYMGRRLAGERCVRMTDEELKQVAKMLGGDATLAAQVIVLRDGIPVAMD